MATSYPVKRYTMQSFLADVEGDKARLMKRSTWVKSGSGRSWDHDEDWTDGISSEQALKAAKMGDAGLASRMMLDVEKYQTTTRQSLAFKTVNGLAGVVSVPRYLCGQPDCMRSRQRIERAARHVNIYVGTVCSAAISAKMMNERGAIILGLLEMMRGMQIGVDVHLLGEAGSKTLYVIEVPSRPLDLSMSGFAIGHIGFTRGLLYSVAARDCGSDWLDWPLEKHRKNDKQYIEWIRETIDAQPQDIIIPGVIGHSDEVLTDPKAWLEKMITQVTGTTAEG